MNSSNATNMSWRGKAARYLIMGASSLVLAATAAPAFAADAPAPAKDDGSTLSEVVVTAEFREQNLQKTPLSITAVNADQLQERSITNVIDVAQAAPNVTMQIGSGGYGKSNQATIRGIGQADFSYAFEPRVGFYIDDVYYATVFGSVFDLLDVNRVEVERGPQGTLNGRNSVGGAIRIFTQKPKGDNSGYIEGTYGSYKRASVRGTIDMSLVPDKLMLRVSAGEHRQDGWVTREDFACANPTLAGSFPSTGINGRNGCKVGTLGGDNVFDARAQLRWIVSDKIENNFSIDYTDDRSEAPADTQLAATYSIIPGLPGGTGVPANQATGISIFMACAGGFYGLPSPLVPGTTSCGAPFPGMNQVASPLPANSAALLAATQPSDPYVTYAQFTNPGGVHPSEAIQVPPISTVRSWGMSDNIDVDLGDLKLTSITAYREYTGEFGTAQSQFAFPIQEVYNEVAHHQFSEELRLSGSSLANRLDWTLGGFYLKTFNENSGRIDEDGFSIYIAGLGTLPYLFDQYVDDVSTLKNESAFVHGVFHFTDQLSLEGGVRYSHETKNYSYYRHYFVGANPDFTYDAPSTSIHRWNPRLALNYQATDNLLFYASYSTGYTAGGYDPRPFAAGDANLPFAPEDVKAYEVGFKSELLDRRLRLNADAFYTDWKAIQLTLAGCAVGCPTTSPFYYANAGDAHIKGFEVEAEAHPTADLLITAGLGYTNFQYVSLNPQVNATNDPTGLTLDSPQPGAPALKFTAGIQYDVHVGESATITPRLDYIVQSRVYYGTDRNDPYGVQGGYGLMNARLTYRGADPSWSVSAYVTNLTDKLYYTSKVDELNSFGTATGTVGRPREFGVTVRRNF